MPSNGSSPLKIDVAGLKVDAITKASLLKQIAERIKRKEKTFVATPYSEFLYASLRETKIRNMLNEADFAIADGIGIFWAHLFLKQKLKTKSFYFHVLQAWGQVVWTGASILLRPSLLFTDIPEKIVGADLVWDLVALAEQNNFSVYILGAHGDIPKITAQKFLQKHPNLTIVGTSNKMMDDPSILSDINQAKPDMILVAFGRLEAEKWIVQNLKDLPASFAIALGGTFDYIAGAKTQPPQFIRQVGLEWLYRLITQPSRLRRIFEATWGLMLSLVRFKVHGAKELRPNAVAVVVNDHQQILLCRRTNVPYKDGYNPGDWMHNYWQFPQGGLQAGESAVDGAKRELSEETGISSLELIKIADYQNSYVWNNATRKLFYPKHSKYKGQKQITLFFKLIGSNDEVRLDQKELIEYRWLAPAEVLQMIMPELKPHAEAVLAELAQIQV
jgi:N-acetylglucosaminyldiphosphoundecaprenol N-acetyl-beta-D-mannosaminyltransferase